MVCGFFIPVSKSEEEHFIFEIKNEHEPLSIGQLSKFFERGYSTKQKDGKRGLGLWNVKSFTNSSYVSIIMCIFKIAFR